MKKLSILLLIVMLALCGCSKATATLSAVEEPVWEEVIVQDDLFKITVVINKFEFETDEEINMYTKLEYIGDYGEIDSWSTYPVIQYSIYNDETVYCTALEQEPSLTMSKFKKGEIYEFPFEVTRVKEEVETDEAVDSKNNNEIKLVEGSYRVEVACDFLDSYGEEAGEYTQINAFDIRVGDIEEVKEDTKSN